MGLLVEKKKKIILEYQKILFIELPIVAYDIA